MSGNLPVGLEKECRLAFSAVVLCVRVSVFLPAFLGVPRFKVPHKDVMAEVIVPKRDQGLLILDLDTP